MNNKNAIDIYSLAGEIIIKVYMNSWYILLLLRDFELSVFITVVHNSVLFQS